jgi:hypothetical protein
LVERMAGGLAAMAIGDTASVRAVLDWLPAHLA